jgi:Uma2 family endonuclease
MIQVATKTTTFDEFIAWLPERSACRYELYDGEIIEMPKARGQHSRISGFIIAELNIEIRKSKLPDFIPSKSLVKSMDSTSGYEPDAIILNERLIDDESRWEKESILMSGNTIPLIVEVVSTNWQDDYWTKFLAYQELGIAEYWIVDYLGLGGRRFIGNPKQPTISVCQLVDGEYDVQLFRDSDVLQSVIFPELEITANQIFMV